MTDLERALAIMPETTKRLLAEARREGEEKVDDAWAAGRRQGLLEGAGPMASWQLTQAYERGAAEMRERAAQVVEAYPGHPRKRADWEERVVRTCVDVIRALPLTPEEPV